MMNYIKNRIKINKLSIIVLLLLVSLSSPVQAVKTVTTKNMLTIGAGVGIIGGTSLVAHNYGPNAAVWSLIATSTVAAAAGLLYKAASSQLQVANRLDTLNTGIGSVQTNINNQVAGLGLLVTEENKRTIDEVQRLLQDRMSNFDGRLDRVDNGVSNINYTLLLQGARTLEAHNETQNTLDQLAQETRTGLESIGQVLSQTAEATQVGFEELRMTIDQKSLTNQEFTQDKIEQLAQETRTGLESIGQAVSSATQETQTKLADLQRRIDAQEHVTQQEIEDLKNKVIENSALQRLILSHLQTLKMRDSSRQLHATDSGVGLAAFARRQ